MLVDDTYHQFFFLFGFRFGFGFGLGFRFGFSFRSGFSLGFGDRFDLLGRKISFRIIIDLFADIMCADGLTYLLGFLRIFFQILRRLPAVPRRP